MATLGAFSPSYPVNLHYSDAVSTVHPDRPIRPLPKRRLRSRISDEEARSILHSSTPTDRLFRLPYYSSSNVIQHPISPNSSLESPGSDHQYSKQPHNLKAADKFAVREDRDIKLPDQSTDELHRTTLSPLSPNDAGSQAESWQKLKADPQSLASSAESVDGYESFENTNNKKKRKIPTNGGHQSSLSAEMASMGLSSSREIDQPQADADAGVGHYYGTGSSAVLAKSASAISNTSKSRHGRTNARLRSARSPLGVSANGLNRNHTAFADGDMTKEDLSSPPDRGLISNAIAKASALPSKSERSVSNSDPSQSSKKSPTGKTKFTFTCESDSAKGVAWPGYGQLPMPGAYPDSVSNGLPSQVPPTLPSRGGEGSQMGPPVKPRRSLSKQYAMAARDRRMRQIDNNFHHPPKEEDVWICEYCEYEAIFGTPPEALLRQYEIKDRRERRRLAEKRRLLDKAKMKGKRGKKGSKNAKNANATAQAQQASNQKQRYDQEALDDPTGQPGPNSDEYVYDDYDDDPAPTPTPPPQTARVPESAPLYGNQAGIGDAATPSWAHP